MRVALGLSYLGQAYEGWQSQRSGLTVQDKLEAALSDFCQQPVHTLCAGRTDSGVHGLMQVVHLDTNLTRDMSSWVRGTNAFLPADIAVQWAQEVPPSFHARGSALGRRYVYVVLSSPVRPSLESGRVGWVFRPLALPLLQQAHDRERGKNDDEGNRRRQRAQGVDVRLGDCRCEALQFQRQRIHRADGLRGARQLIP